MSSVVLVCLVLSAILVNSTVALIGIALSDNVIVPDTVPVAVVNGTTANVATAPGLTVTGIGIGVVVI